MPDEEMTLEAKQPLWCKIQHREIEKFMEATVANHNCLETKVDKLLKVVYGMSGGLAVLMFILEFIKPLISGAVGAE